MGYRARHADPSRGPRRVGRGVLTALLVLTGGVVVAQPAGASNNCSVIPPYYMNHYLCQTVNYGVSITVIFSGSLPHVTKNRVDSLTGDAAGTYVKASMFKAPSYSQEYAAVIAYGLAIASFPPTTRDAPNLQNLGLNWRIKANLYSIDQ